LPGTLVPEGVIALGGSTGVDVLAQRTNTSVYEISLTIGTHVPVQEIFRDASVFERFYFFNFVVTPVYEPIFNLPRNCPPFLDKTSRQVLPEFTNKAGSAFNLPASRF